MSGRVQVYRWRHLAYGPDGYRETVSEVRGPLFHGSRAALPVGALLTAGHPTNAWGDEGDLSQFVHFTTRLETAAAYAREFGSRGRVYEVKPVGELRGGYGGDEYKSADPLLIVREVPRTEWNAPTPAQTRVRRGNGNGR